MAQKGEISYEYFTVKKRKTLFVSTFDWLIWLEDLHRVGGDVGEFGGWGGGGLGRLSFRDADVVPFSFDLDFPWRFELSGVDCGWKRRENRTVPAVEMKNIRKGTREEEKAWKLVREKGGGG